MTFSIKIACTLGAMIAALLCASVASANNNPDYYYYKGQQYSFAKNDTTVSVTFTLGKGPMEIDHPAIEPDPIGSGGAPDCYVYQLRDTWTHGVDSAIVDLNQDALQFDILVTNPVLHYETTNESADVYASSGIGVKLKPGMNISQVTSAYDVEVVMERDTSLASLGMYAASHFGVPYDPSALDETNEYILRVTPGSGKTLFKIANEIYESNDVEFASPDLSDNDRPGVVESVIPKGESAWGENADDPYRVPRLGISPETVDEVQINGLIEGDSQEKGDPNDTHYSWQWNLHGDKGIGYPKTWELPPQGEGAVVIAIISVGFPYSHTSPDINPDNIWDYDAAGNDNTAPDNIPDGDVSIPDANILTNPYKWLQGDQAVLTIAATTNNNEGIAGIASGGIRILRIKAVDNNGHPQDSDFARASDLPSLMAAFGIVSGTFWTFNLYAPSDMVEAAIDRAYKYHQVVVCGAKRDNGGLAFPANLSKTISVAGTNPGGYVMAWNGPGADFAAPGVQIYTGDPPGALGLSPDLDFCAGDSLYACTYYGPAAAGAVFMGAVARVFQQVPQATGMWYNDDSRLGIANYHPMDYITGVFAATDEPISRGNVQNGRINIYQALAYVWRGDADGSTTIDIDDVVYLINYIFSGGPPPESVYYDSGNANCSGDDPTVDIDDVVYLIGYVFSGGPSPFGACYRGDYVL